MAWKDLVRGLEGHTDTSGEMLALNGATARSGGVGFANKIVERKGETYVEDKVVDAVPTTTGSYFNFAKYNR